MDTVQNFIAVVKDFTGKYLVIYIDWLTEKLGGQSSFGMLTLATSFMLFLIAIYLWLRAKD